MAPSSVPEVLLHLGYIPCACVLRGARVCVYESVYLHTVSCTLCLSVCTCGNNRFLSEHENTSRIKKKKRFVLRWHIICNIFLTTFVVFSLKNSLKTHVELSFLIFFFFLEEEASVFTPFFFFSLVSTFFYMTQHYTINTLTPQWIKYIWGHSAVCKTSTWHSELREKLYNPLYR